MQKTCANQWCKQSFEITDADLAFYDKISPVLAGKKYLIPPPTLCPDCRRQRRLSWRNERTLYQRSCDLCKKSIVTVHSPENPYPVFCNPCWYTDKWDPLSFGKPFDPARPFLDQFRELYDRVVQRAMVNDDGVMSENCAYCQDVAFAKNCYLCFGMWKMQDCIYCRICDQSKFCVDCEGVKLGSELAYESVDSQRIYRCIYLQNSENCTDCAFGFDLKGCTDCIACAGLRQKQYHIFNKPHTKEDYMRALASYGLKTRTGIEKLQKEFAAFILTIPRKNMNLQNCENCFGDHLFHCKDVHEGYVCTNSQYSKWIERSDAPVHCYDITQAGAPQWCYDCVTVDDNNMSCFCIYANQSHNAIYSDNCLSSDFLLGCVSLRRKKYCILNTQYTKEEYEALSGTIIQQMIDAGGFGGFFPIHLSPFGYNETNAAESYPLRKEDVIARGWKWRDRLPHTTGKETLKPDQLPNDIRDATDSILREILACTACGKNYRIIQQELDFYRNMGIPPPCKCPDCRNLERLARRNPPRLWQRACVKCQKQMWTTYSLDRPESVYCEACYLKEVY
ncbi:MAG: hypothetical protein HOO67_06495 [Candidatus Peribacteraceae bacterium]|nr:hypothetical protein [Candidatus Peribacteraceae bacterium]